MNQKVQSLIDGGFISIKDVLDWANNYMLEQSMAECEDLYEHEFEPQEHDPNEPAYPEEEKIGRAHV